MRYSAIDIFSGCGGLSTGLKQAGFRVIGALELNELAAASYRLNHRKVCMQVSDIRHVDVSNWMKAMNLKRGQLDLLAGCPPCQGFSSIRTQNGFKNVRDSRNSLVKEMGRLVEEFLPRTVLMENVPGLEDKTVFKQLIKHLRSLGYLPQWTVHDVSYFGVPQRRKRLVLVAGMGFVVPFPSISESRVTVRSAISNLKSAGSSGDPLHDITERRSPLMLQRFKATPKDGGSRSAWPDHLLANCHKQSNGFNDVYGRMKWDDVAPTLTGGCFNPSKGRFLHPEEDRCITMREAALLQTFPGRYRFPSSTGKQALALMIGNALPPEFAKRQGRSLISALKTRDKQWGKKKPY